MSSSASSSSSSSSSSLFSVVCRRFSPDEIKDATNNFEVILGKGGEAIVYLGHIAIGGDEEKIPVAVKHNLNPNSIQFEKEIKIVSKIQHPNLVSLLGYCNESDKKILIYEYMQMGSLSDYVKKKISTRLSWKQRLNICLDAARGLQYLHTETDELPKGIIHRDIKPANILLDKNWVAKVSDFGIIKLSHADQTNSAMVTAALKGTSGYCAPEYVKTFQITRKIDVYAFGVVLFQVLCRKMPWDREDQSYYIRDDEDLGVWAQENVDTEINGEVSDDSLKIFVDIIGRSLRPNPDNRPTMDNVVLDLERALTCPDNRPTVKESAECLNNQVKENQKCFSRQLPAASSMFAADVEAFESRNSTFEAIMKALKDDEVNMIGVYGMGGIGKTTMVKQVAIEAEQRKLFDEFAIAVVSQKPDIRKIQSDIAEMLGLKLDVENEYLRAGRLLEGIMNKGTRILLVLDDLWETIDLAVVGIPHGRSHAGKCCKIVLTSRDLDVCKQMNCHDPFFQLNVLSETDAWNFFRGIVGDAVDSPDLHPIATEIVAKCAGLPIAIKAIAGALKGKRHHIHDWEDAREQLRNSTAKNIPGVHKNVYPVLKWSYDFLESDELRYCFLISCLFEEDADIEIGDLVRYGLGLNLFQGVRSVEGARNRAHVLVGILKARCLLMDGTTDNSATMHDVIRDFAHCLTSNDGEHVFLVRQGVEINEWPDRDAYNRYTAISLLSHQISELPEGLDCPKLKILIFEHIRNWGDCWTELKIPSHFFQGMKQLRVLKMSGCSMPSISASIALLKDLETLCLEYSELEDLSQIGGLKKLKVLSLAGSYFEELPREIGLLTNLMILDLTGCQKLKVVPPNLISSLTQLECLYLLNAHHQWSWGGSNATVDELKHLRHLNTIEMQVSDISLLPRDLPFQNLIRFRVCLGEQETGYRFLRRDLEKMLVISLEPDHNNTLPDWVKTLMIRAQALVIEFKGYNYPAEEYPHPSSLSDLNKGGFATLKYLEVMNNYSMKYLVDSSNASPTIRSFFPLLEELKLEWLGLNEICSGDLPDGSFGELRELELYDLPKLTKLWSMNDSARYPNLVNLCSVSITACKELKYVFPQSASTLLGQLQDLTVKDCESLEGIFLEDRPEMGEVIQLPRLRSLTIDHVPSLTSFCFQKDKASASAGQLFATKILLPALEELNFFRLDESINIWLTQLLPESSCRLRRIYIYYCKSIVTVFPSNVQHCLQNLAHLTIDKCESLEAILEAEVPLEFPSLTEIGIRDCPKLKAFAAAASSMVNYNSTSNINVADPIPPFFNETVAFPALEKLNLERVHMPKEIWHPRLLPVNSFCSLTEVAIVDCGSLITIFPSNVLPRLQNLRNIEIQCCDLLERVFDVDGTSSSKVTLPALMYLCVISNLRGDLIQNFFNGKIVFPALKGLNLTGLHDLKEIWHPQLNSGESFHRLESVRLDNCNSLVTIFPSSVLRRLKNLEKIYIIRCKLVEEVFGFDDEDDATVSAMMIPLHTIDLRILPNLVRFGQGTAGFPSLKYMTIENCPKMKTFMGAHEHNPSGDFVQPFFHEKVDLPVLEELDIRGLQDVEELWHDRSQAGSFCQLEEVSVSECSKLLKVFPLRLLLTMKNLNKIQVLDCESVKELVDEGTVDDAILSTRCHLRELKLQYLPKLTELWWNKDRSGIFSCPDLEELVVTGCHGLRNIFVPSAIKHDMNIQELEIADCSNMEEVVGEEEHGGYSGDKLLFHLVKKMSLENLPNLRSFCRGNYILEWPSLSKMVMNNCPNMATFCLGPVTTPQLKGLSPTEYTVQVLWEGGDLNKTIQHLFSIQRETGAKEKQEEETTTTATQEAHLE